MSFKSKCLQCGQVIDSTNYNCSCNKNTWIDKYRLLDIQIDLKRLRQSIVESFNSYSFDQPLGMLQYQGLPFLEYLPEVIKTVGITPLYKLPSLSHRYQCRVYLKDEGQNPSGCFKDRETMMCLLNSNRRHFKKAVIYSSGNAAASATTITQNTSRQLITFVAGDTFPEKIDYIRNHGADVVIIGDKETSFEEGYELFSCINAADIFSQHHFDNWSVTNPARVQGDKTIAVEIIKQLSTQGRTVIPDYVVVPTANGSCLAGIWKGFKELLQVGLIKKLPKMVAAGIKGASPVHQAVEQKQIQKPISCNLSDVAAQDAEAGSTILVKEGYDSIEAAKAVLQSEGLAIELHSSDINEALKAFLTTEGKQAEKYTILPEPASLTSLAAIKKMKQLNLLSASHVVAAISTGHGRKAKNKIQGMMSDTPPLQQKVDRIIARRKEQSPPPTKNKGKKIKAKATMQAMIASFKQLQNNPRNVLRV